MKQHFRNDELKRFGTLDQIDIDDDDIDFIVRQVWKSRCAVTNRKFGGHSALALTRWDESKDPTPYNLVLMLPEEVLKIGDSGKAHLSASVVESINSRLKWAQTVYAEDFTYAKGAYKMQTKTVYLPIQDNQNRNVQRIHTTNAKSIVVLAQVTSLFLAMAFLKNSFV